MYEIRAVIVHPDENARKRLKELLKACGHLVTAEVSDAGSGVRLLFQTQPDIIIVSPAVGAEAVQLIEEHRVAPVLLVVENSGDFLAELRHSWVFGLISLEMNVLTLEGTVQMAIANFKRLKHLEEEMRVLQRTLKERKLIERAKGLISEKKGLSERQAFEYLRKISMDHCLPLAKVAAQIIRQLHG